MAKEYRVKLLRKEKLAKDTWLFAYEKPEDYVFIPGQYQSVTLALQNGKTDWRDFTIASNPTESELWTVTKITDKPSAFKKQLLELPIGSFVTLQGGSGGFVLDAEEKRSYVFIAGGIGITVFRSMLTDPKYKKVNVTLVASFSTKEHHIFQDELLKLAAEQKNKHVVYTYSNENGRISESFLKENLSGIPDSIFMIAGKQDFVDDMSTLLLGMEVLQGNIRIDYFSGY